MYNNKFVCCVKANSQILREFKDTTYIPFGSEYSILLKNLNTTRASVRVSIDGTDATENVALVVNPNSEFELTRFIKNGNVFIGNRFKFIERTAQIEQHRGVGVEDGLIRVEFKFEKVFPVINVWRDSVIGGDNNRMNRMKGATSLNSPGDYSKGISDNSIQCSAASSASMSGQSVDYSANVNDVGITVPGSISNQQFQRVSEFTLEPETHVIVLKLLGENPQGQVVVQPITVQHKPTCVTCGTTNKALAKFCYECGTSLMFL